MSSFATIDGKIVVLAGKSRSGKSSQTLKLVADSHRIIAWDSQDQWSKVAGFTRVDTQADLSAAIIKAGRRAVKIAYVHKHGDIKEDFDLWACKIVHAVGYFGPYDVIAEELADVSTPGKAPEGWGMLVRTQLKHGVNIYAISQRWAEADKTVFNNVKEIYCFQLMPMDIKHMAVRTGIDPDRLKAVKTIETEAKNFITVKCNYLAWNADTEAVYQGFNSYRKKKPV